LFLWARWNILTSCFSIPVWASIITTQTSREIKVDDIIEVQQKGILRTVKVLKIHKNRVGAKLVPDLMEDLTPTEEYEKLEMINKLNIEKRDRGAGRPTKKDRRTITKLKDF